MLLSCELLDKLFNCFSFLSESKEDVLHLSPPHVVVLRQYSANLSLCLILFYSFCIKTLITNLNGTLIWPFSSFFPFLFFLLKLFLYFFFHVFSMNVLDDKFKRLSLSLSLPLSLSLMSALHERNIDATTCVSDKPFNSTFSSSEGMEDILYLFSSQCLHQSDKENSMEDILYLSNSVSTN